MLDLSNISKSYDGQALLRGISLKVRAGQTVCILGPSGSGKSTLLQIIAGLEAPDSGHVLWGRQDLGSTPAHLRNFGLVFQDYALFPHLNVFENVAFGLKMKNGFPGKATLRVHEVLQWVGLLGFERRSVIDLSGGEQQRVALARALAPRPRLLMLDEPLGALDRALRETLLDQLRGVLRAARTPTLYVTHDQDEAFRIADRVLLLHSGRIVRAGSPADVWAHPGSAWVAEFLGLGDVLPGTIVDTGTHVQTEHGTYALSCGHHHKRGELIHVLLRPHGAPSGTVIRGIVRDVFFQSASYRVMLTNGLHIEVPRAPRIGGVASGNVTPECLGRDRNS
jgi:ABC-type Fe3+/spermidine/putrescine transport system ATPase subunit